MKSWAFGFKICFGAILFFSFWVCGGGWGRTINTGVFLSRIQGDVRLGSPSLQADESRGGFKRVRSPQKIEQAFVLETGEKSQARLDVGEGLSIVLLSESRMEMAWTGGELASADRVSLVQGRVRVDYSGLRLFRIETPTAQVELRDSVVLVRHSGVGGTELSVLSGFAELMGSGQAEKSSLKSGERALFQAELQEGIPVFDELLHGRKAVRGKVSEIQILGADGVTQFLQETRFERPKIVPKKQKLDPKFLCLKPPAELNQCAWICEGRVQIDGRCAVEKGARCVRRRCAASGEWRDALVLPASMNRCQKSPLVQTCDY
ncbi:MAG: FecR family protein [Bdellovibrio sp.]